MEEQRGLSLVGVIVTIVVIAFLLAIIMPAFNRPNKRIVRRVVCGTNLKGLGTAMIVYANDYDDKYPQLGKGPWAKELGYSYEASDFKPYDYEGDCTITSSLYLLVREADVSPKSFICPQSTQKEFEGQNTKNLDIVELWDFGPKPQNHVSYSYHNPYGKFPANGERFASFAVAADMNPWFKKGDIISAGDNNTPPQIIKVPVPDRIVFRVGNSQNHITSGDQSGEGQSVLYADGHVSYEKIPNVGVRWDNIYTFWSIEENPNEQERSGGTAPTDRSPENDAKSKEDSFLVI